MAQLLTQNGNNVKPFRLSENFIEKYKTLKAPFGFGGFGELVYFRTYSRTKENGQNEQWWETIQRVIEGTYNIQKKWIEQHELGWNAHQAQYSAQEMYDRMFNMKFLPPGRGLWAMGTDLIEVRNLAAALNNCSFISTEYMKDDPSKPFTFLMDMSMLGVGVGFDTKGANTLVIKGLDKDKKTTIYQIPDTREGWVESVKLLLDSYFQRTGKIEFDYSIVRPKGEPIKTFGGVASGPEPLMELHESLRLMLEENTGKDITSTVIVDIQNMIGKTVVAGNVRRTAEIALGDYNDQEYMTLKDYKWDKKNNKYIGNKAYRADRGWASNNSILADIGMDYSLVGKLSSLNGEPGYVWLKNIQAYSRMDGIPDHKDHKAVGTNPCNEQSLESMELCCLVENFIDRHDNIEDFLRTLKFSYLYAKTVTLLKTHWPETNRVMLRNRRIGCSLTGIAQFISSRGMGELKNWCQAGYTTIQHWDKSYSDWFAVPTSIKTTSIKPSGTVSQLPGATPGCHFPLSRYFIRRMRISKISPLVKPLMRANYNIEEDVADKTSYVVSFPIQLDEKVKTIEESDIWEQVSLAAFLQKYWSDNQVSCTVTFDPETEAHKIDTVLDYYQYQLKGISFLPNDKEGAYAQMPYEKISKEKFIDLSSKLKRVNFSNVSNVQAELDRFCDSDTCEVTTPEKQGEIKNA